MPAAAASGHPAASVTAGVRLSCTACDVAWTSTGGGRDRCWCCARPGVTAPAPSIGKDGRYSPVTPATGTWGLLTGDFVA